MGKDHSMIAHESKERTPPRTASMTEVVGNLWRSMGRVWRIGVEVEKKYSEDGGPLIAAAISFFVILSLIPLLLLAVWGLGRFLSSEQAFRHVVQYVGDYLP